MNTKIMIALLVGILGLYAGNVLTGTAALIATIVGFAAVMMGCVLSFRRFMDKQNR